MINNNTERLSRALNDLGVLPDCECRKIAEKMNEELSGYSLFWGMDDNGAGYIEWFNGENHNIVLNIF